MSQTIRQVFAFPARLLAATARRLLSPLLRWHADHLAAALARRLDLAEVDLVLNSVVRDLMRLQIEVELLRQMLDKAAPAPANNPGLRLPFPEERGNLPKVW